MTQTLAIPRPQSSKAFKYVKNILMRVVPVAVLAIFFPRTVLTIVGIFVILGLLDVLRNRPLRGSLFYGYFFGNGTFTWLLAPFNLLMDVISLPYWNKGIYKLADLPKPYQAEIQTLIDAAHNRNLIGALEEKMGDRKRGMIFFQWYGQLIPTSLDIPEFKQSYKYLRTIGVSIFNKKQSTSRHFGPLRVTFRVLYNINAIDDPNVYVQVGDVVHRWRDEKLFIFDDTLQHESHNESDAIRYCLFVDMLRPSLIPAVFRGIVSGVSLLVAPFKSVFYKHWTFIK